MAVTVILCVKLILQQTRFAACIYEAFSQQLSKEPEAWRSFSAKETANEEVYMINGSALFGTAPHQASQGMLMRDLPNTPLPFLALFTTRSSVSVMVRRCKRHDKHLLYPRSIFKVDVHLMHEKTKHLLRLELQPAQCNGPCDCAN